MLPDDPAVRPRSNSERAPAAPSPRGVACFAHAAPPAASSALAKKSGAPKLPLFSASASGRSPSAASAGTPGSISGPMREALEAERGDDGAGGLAAADHEPRDAGVDEPRARARRRSRSMAVGDRLAAVALLRRRDRLGLGGRIDDRRSARSAATKPRARLGASSRRAISASGIDRRPGCVGEIGGDLPREARRARARRAPTPGRDAGESRCGCRRAGRPGGNCPGRPSAMPEPPVTSGAPAHGRADGDEVVVGDGIDDDEPAPGGRLAASAAAIAAAPCAHDGIGRRARPRRWSAAAASAGCRGRSSG